jgi:transposase
MLADELDFVVGVDTHLDEHVLAVVAAATGAVLARQVVRANERGYQAALRFAGAAAEGARAWAVEGTGSYGAGLARYLAGRGETVLEVSRSPRTERRLRGKGDSLDAARTARAALAGESLALPRNGERREALRLLLVARRSAVDVRREALAQLRGLIVTAVGCQYSGPHPPNGLFCGRNRIFGTDRLRSSRRSRGTDSCTS